MVYNELVFYVRAAFTRLRRILKSKKDGILLGEFMTKKQLLPKIKLFLSALLVLCFFCSCAFFVACNNSDSSESTQKTYTYTETDTDLISNAKFAYGTHGKTESDFPITSPTGWTRSADNSATSSLVDSGVISVADNAFGKVFDKLYADSDFKNIYNHAYKAELEDKTTDDEKKEFIGEKFSNPGRYDENADSFVYMLNNFSATYEKGTAQRVRSSSTVSVKKGEIYEVSVYVKTNILNGDGANIRFTNSVNGNSQAEFRIDNIKNDEWTKYTVYFVANSDYDCTFSLTVGLGYGMGKSDNFAKTVEGTVFFDDVSIEKVDADKIPADCTEIPFTFGSEDIVSVNPTDNNVYKYDMNFDAPEGYFNGVNFYETVELNKESKTLVIKNGENNFNITTEDQDDYAKYMLVSFRLQNKLNPLGSTDISVNVKDIYGALEPETRTAVATFSDVSDGDEFTTCYIVVKNNFKNQSRDFYLELVIGPADAASVQYDADFASGTVTVKDVKFAEGYVNDTDDATYKYFSFLNSNANATVALYAGYNADNEQHNHSDSYSLTPAKSNVGQIVNEPTAVDGYYGIVSNHVYVKGEEETTLSNAVNERTSFTYEEGYAGLVNTKYIDNYPEELQMKLAGLYEKDDIQPIVIYNKYLDNYGFIGASQNVSASAYAKITVKLKAFDNAKAFIYLVDTSKSEKEVLSFADFTVNTTDGIKNAGIVDTLIKDKQFMLTVNKNSETGDDGWVEVSFYLATGATAKSFRVEVWNGGRDGSDETKSQGYVIVNSISVSTSSAFSEPTSWAQAFAASGNPLYDAMNEGFDFDELIAYTRKLTETEEAFNKEYPDKAVSYNASYVWAKTDNMAYGIFNTIDPVESDPYATIEPEETGSGCAANTDPSTFWLSFSSIVLAAVLILAVIALVIKRISARRRANKSDIKTQYKVKSRTETQKAIKKAKEQQAKKLAEETEDLTEVPETPTEQADEPASEEAVSPENSEAENTGDETEQTGYVYGEVQDFGDMTLDIPAEEQPSENREEEKKDEE